MSVQEPVPTFYLYGEPQRRAAEHFVHVESLEHRSRPAGWTIRPHAHRDLNHFILIAEGAGLMQAEAAVMHFHAPCLLLVPSKVIHGFRWRDESTGYVVTIANSYREDLIRRDPELQELFDEADIAPLTAGMGQEISAQALMLIRELGWQGPGHRTAVEAALASIVVQAMRSKVRHRADARRIRGRHEELVARFHQIVEDRFRLREPVDHYAALLGTSCTTLRLACRRIVRASPTEIVNLRAFLEAKRALCYTNQSVAAIAYGLGFVDPAYFTRAFTKHIGLSPRQFRIAHEAGTL